MATENLPKTPHLSPGKGNPEGSIMKKSIVAAILVLALASLAVSADCFDVDTIVEGINMMKITMADCSQKTQSQFEEAPSFQGPLNVTTPGAQTNLTAWLSTLSNEREGYTVSMSATPMKSCFSGFADAYINYTVTVNDKSITTAGPQAAAAVDVITIATLSSLDIQSHQIALNVDQGTFHTAVEGQYSGTVTFTYTNNT